MALDNYLNEMYISADGFNGITTFVLYSFDNFYFKNCFYDHFV